ncbi:MAG: ferrochelatase [bacterium]
MTAEIGLLLMAYGSPQTLDDVEAYYTHIRGGRPASREAVESLRDRYRRIGGRSPLPEITQRQTEGTARALRRKGISVRAYVGMKHAPPFIDRTVAQMSVDGIRLAVGIALAPHYSRMSIGGYVSAAGTAAAEHGLLMRCVESYHDHPGLITALAHRIEVARGLLGGDREVPVIFTAHSLPRRILEWGDPYPDQLRRTCELVAAAAAVSTWQFAFQSASHTGEPWLGPDVGDVLRDLRERGARAVIVSPVGFVADHLEVLYDLDVQARETAETLEMRMVRAASLNDSPDFLEVLADVASAAIGDPRMDAIR